MAQKFLTLHILLCNNMLGCFIDYLCLQVQSPSVHVGHPVSRYQPDVGSFADHLVEEVQNCGLSGIGLVDGDR